MRKRRLRTVGNWRRGLEIDFKFKKMTDFIWRKTVFNQFYPKKMLFLNKKSLRNEYQPQVLSFASKLKFAQKKQKLTMPIASTNFQFPTQTAFYRGKVRDVYSLGDDRLLMVASDRISAFDHILTRPIPQKGQVLNQIAAYFLEKTRDICPNWLISSPDPNVALGWRCEPIRVEMVIRGYVAGHAAREYLAGKRVICGVSMPDGLRESDPFPEPIITPTTKADAGHDADISREEILKTGLVGEADYLEMERITRALFKRGTEMAAKRGLILVDTKYEFGKKGGQIMLMDEIHTPDSSRYFYADGYDERQKTGQRQRQLSKEFVREWLIANGFQGLEGQKMPEMPDDFLAEISTRYVELFEKITGKKFKPADDSKVLARIEKAVLKAI
jgi:phosphoribosylaminoimidazole-succinocarboxamide synthase